MLALLALVTVVHAADTKPDKKKADDKKPETTVKVGGTIYSHYHLDLTDGATLANDFGVDRAYLNVVATIGDHFGARITTDVGALDPLVTDSGDTGTVDTKLRTFLKYSWLEWKSGHGIKVRGGLVNTAYLPDTENFLGFRWIDKTMGDANKIMSTSDFGLNVNGGAGKGLVDWTVALTNGESYGKPEVSGGKLAAGRVTIDPMSKTKGKHLPITAYVGYGLPDTGEDGALTYAANLGFKMHRLVAAAEYIGTSAGGVSGGGYSITVSPRMPKYGGIYLRYDDFNADTSVSKGGNGAMWAGVYHDFEEKISLGLNYKRTWADAAPDLPTQGIAIQMQAGF